MPKNKKDRQWAWHDTSRMLAGGVAGGLATTHYALKKPKGEVYKSPLHKFTSRINRYSKIRPFLPLIAMAGVGAGAVAAGLTIPKGTMVRQSIKNIKEGLKEELKGNKIIYDRNVGSIKKDILKAKNDAVKKKYVDEIKSQKHRLKTVNNDAKKEYNKHMDIWMKHYKEMKAVGRL